MWALIKKKKKTTAAVNSEWRRNTTMAIEKYFNNHEHVINHYSQITNKVGEKLDISKKESISLNY